MTTLNVGFIGLGAMGSPMAQNILKKGFSLTVFNRTKEKAKALLDRGAKWAESPSELAASSDVVITMVANDDALRSVSREILKAPKQGLIHISMSTVSPGLIKESGEEHRKKGTTLLSAPVSGRPERARTGTLWIFLAGNPEIKSRVEPILQAMSCKVFDLGNEAARANIFKLCSNFMILSLIESLSEALTLLEKNGISAETATKIWGDSFFDAPIFHNYTPMLISRAFQPAGFALQLGLKDMRLLQACADSTETPMPLLSLIHEKLLTSMAMGRKEFDWAAIALLTREAAGL